MRWSRLWLCGRMSDQAYSRWRTKSRDSCTCRHAPRNQASTRELLCYDKLIASHSWLLASRAFKHKHTGHHGWGNIIYFLARSTWETRLYTCAWAARRSGLYKYQWNQIYWKLSYRNMQGHDTSHLLMQSYPQATWCQLALELLSYAHRLVNAPFIRYLRLRGQTQIICPRFDWIAYWNQQYSS